MFKMNKGITVSLLQVVIAVKYGQISPALRVFDITLIASLVHRNLAFINVIYITSKSKNNNQYYNTIIFKYYPNLSIAGFNG